MCLANFPQVTCSAPCGQGVGKWFPGKAEKIARDSLVVWLSVSTVAADIVVQFLRASWFPPSLQPRGIMIEQTHSTLADAIKLVTAQKGRICKISCLCLCQKEYVERVVADQPTFTHSLAARTVLGHASFDRGFAELPACPPTSSCPACILNFGTRTRCSAARRSRGWRFPLGAGAWKC